jgi:hypothetical protein
MEEDKKFEELRNKIIEQKEFIENLKQSLDLMEGRNKKLEYRNEKQQEILESLQQENQELIEELEQLKTSSSEDLDYSGLDLTVDKEEADRKLKEAIEIGDEGEDQTSAAIKRMSDIGYIINNLRFHYGKLKYTVEIDNIFVCNRGVFVFETKNWGAEISGDTSSKYWKYKNPKIERDVYSPVEQNNTHIRQIRNVAKFQMNVQFHSVIVFPGTTTFKLTKMEDFFIKPEQIREFIESKPVVYTEEEAKELYRMIMQANEPITHAEHLANIKSRKNNKFGGE